MPARLEFPNAASYESFGNLVKRWATNLSAKPANPQDLQQQLDQAGVSFRVPPEITNVNFVTWPGDPNILTILLPPASAIVDAELHNQGRRGNYPLPPFYRPAFGSDPNVDFEEFNAQRIGEYCINQCQ